MITPIVGTISIVATTTLLDLSQPHLNENTNAVLAWHLSINIYNNPKQIRASSAHQQAVQNGLNQSTTIENSTTYSTTTHTILIHTGCFNHQTNSWSEFPIHGIHHELNRLSQIPLSQCTWCLLHGLPGQLQDADHLHLDFAGPKPISITIHVTEYSYWHSRRGIRPSIVCHPLLSR